MVAYMKPWLQTQALQKYKSMYDKGLLVYFFGCPLSLIMIYFACFYTTINASISKMLLILKSKISLL